MSGKYALIVANTEYSDTGLAQLTAPGKDAEDFAQVLKDRAIGAFDDVSVLLNQPEYVVREAINDFFNDKRPDDLLIFYFSGHGVRDELGALYLAVKNTTRNKLRATGIKSDYIREAMDQSRSKRQVLILDCCNSGAFSQGTKAATGVSIGTSSAFESGFGRIILTASDSTQYAWEGDKIIGETDNSLFTHFLVEGLKGEADLDSDGRITVDELYDYAYEKVQLATPQQTPSKFSSKQQGEIILRDNIRIEDTKVVSLPDDLLTAIKSSLPYVREGAIRQLELLLTGRNRALARSAQLALEKIVSEDDSRTVQQAAAKALEAAKGSTTQTLRPTRKPDVTSVREVPPKIRDLKLAFSPIGRWISMGLAVLLLLTLGLWGINKYQSGNSNVFPSETAAEFSIPITGGETTPVASDQATVNTPPPLPEVISLPVPENLAIPVGSEKISLDNFGRVNNLAIWGRGSINQVVYSPNGSLIAAATSTGIYIFNSETFFQTQYLESGDYINSVAFSPGGLLLASSSWDNTIKLWNLENGSLIRTFEGHSADVTSLAFSYDGDTIASASLDHTIRLWNVKDGALKSTLTGHTGPVRSIAYSPDGATLASGSDDRSIRFWNVDDGTQRQILGGHTDSVLSVAFAPNGEKLASGSADDTVRVWDPSNGTLIDTFALHKADVNSVAYSKDSEVLASGSDDHSIILLGGYPTTTLIEHTDPVLSVTFSPRENTLATSSLDGTIRLWGEILDYRLDEVILLQTLAKPAVNRKSLVFSPDGQLLAASSNNDVGIWRVLDGTLLQTLSGHTGEINGVAFSPDGKMVASGSEDHTVRIWDISGATSPVVLGGHQDAITGVAFSPDGTMLASSSKDSTIRLWRISDGSLLFTLDQYINFTTVEFSPDGQTLAAGATNGLVYFWNPNNLTTFETVDVEAGVPYGLSFSKDGQFLAMSMSYGTTHIIRMIDKSAVLSMERDGEPAIYSVAFAPDGKIIATSSSEEMVTLWNANDGTFLRYLAGHADIVYDLAFSPDSLILASASADGTIRLWGIGK